MLLAVLALLAADPPEASTTDKLADVKLVYEKTCRERAYGAYDDLCDNLKRQIRDYEKDLKREAAEKAAAQSKPTQKPPPP